MPTALGDQGAAWRIALAPVNFARRIWQRVRAAAELAGVQAEPADAAVDIIRSRIGAGARHISACATRSSVRARTRHNSARATRPSVGAGTRHNSARATRPSVRAGTRDSRPRAARPGTGIGTRHGGIHVAAVGDRTVVRVCMCHGRSPDSTHRYRRSRDRRRASHEQSRLEISLR